jgi:hypothetical protein
MALNAKNRVDRKETDEKFANCAHGLSLTLLRSVGAFPSGR